MLAQDRDSVRIVRIPPHPNQSFTDPAQVYSHVTRKRSAVA